MFLNFSYFSTNLNFVYLYIPLYTFVYLCLSGYLGTAYQSFLDVLDIIEESELSETEKVTEKQKALDSQKNAFGENYKYYPPWDKN